MANNCKLAFNADCSHKGFNNYVNSGVAILYLIYVCMCPLFVWRKVRQFVVWECEIRNACIIKRKCAEFKVKWWTNKTLTKSFLLCPHQAKGRLTVPNWPTPGFRVPIRIRFEALVCASCRLARLSAASTAATAATGAAAAPRKLFVKLRHRLPLAAHASLHRRSIKNAFIIWHLKSFLPVGRRLTPKTSTAAFSISGHNSLTVSTLGQPSAHTPPAFSPSAAAV